MRVTEPDFAAQQLDKAVQRRQLAEANDFYPALAAEDYWFDRLMEAWDGYVLTDEDLALVESLDLTEAADSMAKASTPEPFSTSKTSNWVARVGGLPNYIQHIAHDIVAKGKSVSHAIAIAIAAVKGWCAGKGNVDSGTRAAACKSTSEWEAKKAKAHAT